MSEIAHEHWLGLRSRGHPAPEGGVATISSGVGTGFGDVRFALTDHGAPRLLVPISSGMGGLEVKALGGPSVGVTVARLLSGDSTSFFIDVSLLEDRLEALFGDLCMEMISRISGGHPPIKAVAGSIEDFRTLLAESPHAPVDAKVVLGLIGELIILREGARHSSNAIESWTGPVGQRHDFRGKAGAIEVKSTGYKQCTNIHVHGLEQLLPPTDAPLWLAYVVLERTQNGPLFIEGLCKQLIEMGVPGAALESRLGTLGCNDPGAPEWNGLRVSLEGMDFYSICPGFPRLTASSMPNGRIPLGINDIQYSVDLSAAASYLVPNAQHDDVIKAVFA